MGDKVKPPVITDQLIKYLAYKFKDQSPDLGVSDRQIWFDAGCVHVVRHLKLIKTQQEANILNKDIT